MRYREMKAVLAAIERADGRYLVHCALAEQPAGDWWVVVRDHKHSTNHQIDDDRRLVERLQGQMATLHTVVDEILALADELAAGTIEKALAKDDTTLGLEILLRQLSVQDH